MTLLGVGTDLVHIPSFIELTETVGSRFADPGQVFTPREWRRAGLRAQTKGDSPNLHLAALWAIKEAALKAWLSALGSMGVNPPLEHDEVVWSEIVVSHSSTGLPSVELVGSMLEALRISLGLQDNQDLAWHVSASHDGGYALAFVTLSSSQ